MLSWETRTSRQPQPCYCRPPLHRRRLSAACLQLRPACGLQALMLPRRLCSVPRVVADCDSMQTTMQSTQCLVTPAAAPGRGAV